MIARPLRLSRRFTLVFAAGLLCLTGMLAVMIEFYLKQSLWRQCGLRARASAASLAAVARPYLLHYDYIALQQMADGVRTEPDVVYVVILDKEGKVAGYGGRRDLVGTHVDGLANQRALNSHGAALQEVDWNDATLGPTPAIEAVAPVWEEDNRGQRWGTVRVGLSLASVRTDLWRARIFLLAVLLTGAIGAVVVSHLLARRITRPLQRLVEATSSFESSATDWEYQPEPGSDEIAELAGRFALVAQSLSRQRRELLAAKDELTALNAKLEQEVERRTGELTESRERYRLLVEGSPDAFVLVEGTRFVFVNEAFEEIFQYPKDKVLQDTFRWTQIIHPNFHRVTRERFRGAEEDGRAFRLEVVGLTRIGRPINLEVRGRSALLHGQPVLELILSDVTEKRRLLGQVVQSERLRAMGEMTAMVAHHFNNLLAVMMGRCQLLQMKTQDESIRAGLNVIQASALKAGDMLRHLQEYYGEQVDLRFGEVDVNAMLRELALYQENIWRTTRPPDAPLVTIRLELEELPPVRGSDPLLQDVFHRLLVNAIEAMPDGGEITVESRAGGDQVTVRVTDPGVGMESDTMAHAFDPFFSTKGKRTRGLGLSAALGIVQRHEGQIRIESKPGLGTTVEVVLPVQSRIARILPMAGLQGGKEPAAPEVQQHQEAAAQNAAQGDDPRQPRQAEA